MSVDRRVFLRSRRAWAPIAAIVVATCALLTTGIGPRPALALARVDVPADDAPTPVPTIIPAPVAPAPQVSAALPTPAPVATGLVPLTTAPAAPRPRRRGDPGNALYAPMRYFAGTKWSCETFSGWSETHFTVPRGPFYGFTLHTIVRLPSGGSELDETYAYDWTRHSWKAALGPGPYRLRAIHLGYNDWIFEGTQVERGRNRPIRMHYHMYDDVIFRRDFETRHAGMWLPYAGETCERNDFADVKM